MSLRAAWRGTRGLFGAYCVSYVLLLVSLTVVHLVVTTWVQHHPDLQPAPWVLFDGALSAFIIMLGIALYATIYRIAAERTETV